LIDLFDGEFALEVAFDLFVLGELLHEPLAKFGLLLFCSFPALQILEEHFEDQIQDGYREGDRDKEVNERARARRAKGFRGWQKA
jgi:hypothetical protein